MKSAPVHLCGAGPGSKRLGIGDDREAVPLTLQIIYSKVSEVGAEPPSQPATAAESSSPELGPRADSSVLSPSSRLPDFLWWPFSIRTLPRRQALGLWAEAGVIMLPSREPSVDEAAGATWRRSAPLLTSARPARSRRN